MKILGTGFNGLVGSRVIELLRDKYEFETISRSSGVDITNQDQISSAIENSDAEIVIHAAAKTNVDGCETDKNDGQNGEAWIMNVNGTENVAKACSTFNKKLIYLSTDFVFDGEKEEGYIEEDGPNPINWYGTTKLEGENIVQRMATPWLILRLAFPYRAQFTKLDFMRAIKERLESNQPIKGITDHICTPTFIDDFARALDILIQNNSTGIYHVAGEQSLTPYHAALEIAHAFELNTSLISEISREEYFKNKAPRPFRLALKNDKIERLGVIMKPFDEGLQEVKRQLSAS